jgi:serine/threonine protein kinase
MGFVEGQSLSQRLAEGPLPAREAADLIRRVSQAIEYAHHRGVIHRDLKPANVLLDKNGNPRVTDFGLAKKLEGDSGLTGSGQIMGTPSYMPPEQAGGKRGDVGPVADVYALGATLYCLVTGRPPFQAATAMDTVLQVISDEPVPPRRLNPSVRATWRRLY